GHLVGAAEPPAPGPAGGGAVRRIRPAAGACAGPYRFPDRTGPRGVRWDGRARDARSAFTDHGRVRNAAGGAGASGRLAGGTRWFAATGGRVGGPVAGAWRRGRLRSAGPRSP